MPTHNNDNTRPDRTACYGIRDSAPIAPKPDRTTYEAARQAQLNHIRQIDLAYRQLLNDFRRQNVRGAGDFWIRRDHSREGEGEPAKVADELRDRQRVLVHAVEGYLLGCVKLSSLTGEIALRQTRNTDELCAALQAEEDLAIKAFGAPWVESSGTFSRSRLYGFQPRQEENVLIRGAATSKTLATWRWPWR